MRLGSTGKLTPSGRNDFPQERMFQSLPQKRSLIKERSQEVLSQNQFQNQRMLRWVRLMCQSLGLLRVLQQQLRGHPARHRICRARRALRKRRDLAPRKELSSSATCTQRLEPRSGLEMEMSRADSRTTSAPRTSRGRLRPWTSPWTTRCSRGPASWTGTTSPVRRQGGAGSEGAALRRSP